MDTRTAPTRREAIRQDTPAEAAFKRVLARVRVNVPPDMTPDEVRVETAEARGEVRQERLEQLSEVAAGDDPELAERRRRVMRLKGIYRDVEPGVSWSEELLRERREEAAREDAE